MKLVVHESSLPWQLHAPGTRQALRAKALCDEGGASKVGVGLLELPEGSDTRPSHYHSHEEEHLYALAGRATLCLGSTEFELTAGSYVCFPAGQEIFHHLENRSVEPFRYLMIGERLTEDRVTHRLA
jgi:uncharacterized cupin superfamily protein